MINCPECNEKMKEDKLICDWCRERITMMDKGYFPPKEDNYDIWLSLVRRGYYLNPAPRNETSLFWWNE